MPRLPSNQAQLQDPATSEGQHDNRAQNRREEQCDGQRQLTVQGQEVQLDALQVLKNEDEGHQQGHHAYYERSPSPAQPGPPLARIRFAGRYLWR